MGQGVVGFVPWAKHREAAKELYDDDAIPVEPYTKTEVLDYIDSTMAGIDATVDGLDLESQDSGFPWYPNFPKLGHEILSIRHVQGHLGQLSELLLAAGVETSWFSRLAPPAGS